MTGPAAPSVLIVDDEELIRRILCRAVEKAGGAPFAVGTCQDARRMVGEKEFACALLDKNLPDGDGIELLFYLRKKQPKVDVTILTGYATLETAVDAFRAGAVNYLIKPFSMEAVQQQVQLVLQKRRAEVEAHRSQQMLIHAERMAAIGVLTASVAHELRSPLAAASLGVELAQSEVHSLRQPGAPLDWSALERALDITGRGLERALRISQDLKSYARTEEDVRQALDVRVPLEAAVQMVMAEIRPKARVVRALGEVPRVLASAPRLEQVFVNLLMNAAQAIAPGAADRNEIRLSTREQDGQVVVEVADSGPGIPPATVERLFEPFFTTKGESGTGLGLHICRTLIRALGGDIQMVSALGEGTRVHVCLPVALASASADAPAMVHSAGV